MKDSDLTPKEYDVVTLINRSRTSIYPLVPRELLLWNSRRHPAG